MQQRKKPAPDSLIKRALFYLIAISIFCSCTNDSKPKLFSCRKESGFFTFFEDSVKTRNGQYFYKFEVQLGNNFKTIYGHINIFNNTVQYINDEDSLFVLRMDKNLDSTYITFSYSISNNTKSAGENKFYRKTYCKVIIEKMQYVKPNRHVLKFTLQNFSNLIPNDNVSLYFDTCMGFIGTNTFYYDNKIINFQGFIGQDSVFLHDTRRIL